MAYEVYSYHGCQFGYGKYIFESLEEIASYYASYFYSNKLDDFRIIDTYDRQHVDPRRVTKIYWDDLNRRRRENLLRYYGNYEFRRGPVPKIHKRRYHRGSYCRYMRNQQERRENDFLNYDEDALEYGIKTRNARKNLANPWDDFVRADTYNRNWKRQRKTQWKA